MASTPLLPKVRPGPDGRIQDPEPGDGVVLKQVTARAPPRPLSTPVLVTTVVLMIAFNVVATVSRKSMYDLWGEKYAFARQICTNALYDIWATLALAYLRVKRGSWASFADLQPRTWAFLVLAAFLDGLADFLQSAAGAGTPGQWQTLLSQARIFFILLLSAVVLKSRYTWVQAAGAVVAVGGAALAIAPQLASNNGHVLWYSTLIFAAADLPTAGSFVVKELLFKAQHLDVFFLTTVVSWVQLALVWVLAPLQALHGLGGVPLHRIPEQFHDGYRCLAADPHVFSYDGNGDAVARCDWRVPAITMLYSLSGFVGGILQLVLIKRVSASYMTLGNAVSLPIANLLFAWPALVGRSNYTALTWWDVGGLVLVVAGFLAFSLRRQSAAPPPH